MPGLDRLRDFVVATTRIVSEDAPPHRILQQVEPLLRDLVSCDDWLPEDCAAADPERYRQYLLHCDPLERFSVVSFVWGPGQQTPVHDHTVWGAVGMLRGAEISTSFVPGPDGRLVPGEIERLEPGQVALVGPEIGDVHQVANALADASSISIHVYGGNIGKVRRHTFVVGEDVTRDFVSGYNNTATPNLW